MKLSNNFSLKEMLKSQTASRLGGAILRAQQNPPPKIIARLKYHCENTAQKARDFLGAAIATGSGYRCDELNTAIGGSKTSQHSKGEATDEELAEAFLTDPSEKAQAAKTELDALVHTITGKPIRKDVNSNFYLFAYYVLFIHLTDVDQVIHEFGEDGEPDWVHVSSSEQLNRRQILIVRKVGKKSVYENLTTKSALMLGC